MLKDLVVNLSVESLHDVAAEFAVSVAAEFGAHIAAMAFAIDRSMPALLTDVMLDDIVDAQKQLQEAAGIAVNRFKTCATAGSFTFDAHVIPATSSDVAYRFGRLARRFDPSILKQAETGGDAPSRP